MRVIVFGIFCAALLGAAEPQTFTGVITDTMCGPRHGMVKAQPDDQCVRMCVKASSSQFALYDGKVMLKLSDQKQPAKFAGRKVTVTGTYDAKTRTIKVTQIEPAS